MLSIPKKQEHLNRCGFLFQIRNSQVLLSMGIPEYISVENLVHNPLLFRYVGQSDVKKKELQELQ